MRYSSLGMLFVSAFGSCDACWDGSVDVAPDAVTPSVEHASPNGVGAWSQTADSTGDDTQVAVVADSTGFWVAGAIGGSANIGCGPHATAAAYVAKYAATGTCLWATYIDGGYVDASALALDAAGSVYVAGSFGGDARFNGGSRSSVGGLDGFLMKVSSDGIFGWARTFGGTDDEYVYAVAAKPGHVAVAGAFNATTSLGGALLVSHGDADGFVAQYTDAGTFEGQHGFGDQGWDAVNSLAFAPSGNLVAAGTFVGNVAFGGQSLTGAGGQDAFLAIYDACLAPVAARKMGGAGDDAAHGLVVDGAHVVTSGYFTHEAAFGQTSALAGSGQHTAFVATYATDLSFVDLRTIDSDGEVIPEAMAPDANGGVVVTGHFTGSMVLGSHNYTANGATNGFVAAYDNAASLRWTTVFGNGTARGLGVASAQGLTVVAGDFTGSVDFGQGAVASGSASTSMLWALVDGAP
jgi:hypothetical protein